MDYACRILPQAHSRMYGLSQQHAPATTRRRWLGLMGHLRLLVSMSYV